MYDVLYQQKTLHFLNCRLNSSRQPVACGVRFGFLYTVRMSNSGCHQFHHLLLLISVFNAWQRASQLIKLSFSNVKRSSSLPCPEQFQGKEKNYYHLESWTERIPYNFYVIENISPTRPLCHLTG